MHRVISSCHRSALVVILFAFLSPLPRSTWANEKTDGKPKGEGKSVIIATTPEMVFEIYQRAIVADDWKTAFQIQTESSRDFMVSGVLQACRHRSAGDAGKALVGEFVDVTKLKELMENSRAWPPADKTERLTREMSALISKKPEFMSRAIELFVKQKKENWLADIGKTKLVKLKIKGDTASGEMEMKFSNGSASEPMRFLRKGERWFIDYTGW